MYYADDNVRLPKSILLQLNLIFLRNVITPNLPPPRLDERPQSRARDGALRVDPLAPLADQAPPPQRLFRREFVQFDQHAMRAARMNERDLLAARADRRRFVDQFHPLGLHARQCQIDVIHFKANVMNAIKSLKEI